jgi:hypothetical protein
LSELVLLTSSSLKELTMNGIARKMRQRRENREFDRALRNASPAMRQELYAAAARQGFRF